MQKVGIIGHFGFGLNLANGQTIKTKIVTDYISIVADNQVKKVDAHGGIRAVVPVIKGCIYCLRNCENIIILLTENGLRVSVPVLSFFNRFFHRRLHYVVIGGWLNKFLDNHKRIESGLRNFDYIYVETKTMENALKNRGYTNVIVMPNSKQLKILKLSEMPKTYSKPYRICTFSRVMREKGIETIAKVINKINHDCDEKVYILDIYGQIDATQTEWFKKLLDRFQEDITYKGVVSFDQSVDILKNYFFLAFPTHFYTEGIPGTIIDAFAAGLPVVSAKWESFEDVIDEGQTGLGYTFDDIDELEVLMSQVAKAPEIIIRMKEKCLKKAQEFTIDKAMKELVMRL